MSNKRTKLSVFLVDGQCRGPTEIEEDLRRVPGVESVQLFQDTVSVWTANDVNLARGVARALAASAGVPLDKVAWELSSR